MKMIQVGLGMVELENTSKTPCPQHLPPPHLTSSSTHTIGPIEKFTMEEVIHLYLVYKLICLIPWCEQKIIEAIVQTSFESVFLIPLILGSAGFKVLVPMRANFYQWHRNVSTEPVATTPT